MFTVKLLVVLVIASILLYATLVRADPPSRSFVGNFIGNDATVENYLSISGGVDRTQNFESLYLEKTISSDASFSLFVGYQRLEQEGEDAAVSGFSNLGLGYKHLLLALPADGFVLTINPTLELPVGDSRVSETHPRAGGDLLFQKGFGDLPESLAIFRGPRVLRATRDFESKVTGARDDLLNADLELEYSLGYLDANVAEGWVPMLLRDLTPHLDFDYAQIGAHNNSSAPDLRADTRNRVDERHVRGESRRPNRPQPRVIRHRSGRLRLAPRRLVRSTPTRPRLEALPIRETARWIFHGSLFSLSILAYGQRNRTSRSPFPFWKGG